MTGLSRLLDLETLAVAIALAVALLPLAIIVGRRSSRTARAQAVLLWAAAVAAITWTAHEFRPAVVDPAGTRPIEGRENGYVSSQACRSCHPDQYDTWYRSYHRTMTQVATVDTVVGSFDDVSVSGQGWQYRLVTRDGELFVEMDPRLGGEPVRPVVMTTGSHHMQDIWVPTSNGDFVELVQSVYLFDDERWVPRESVFLLPPGEERRRDHWNTSCVRCHSTPGLPNEDGGETDTTVTEFGIACEACHGAAGSHAERHNRPWERYRYHFGSEPDTTIVHPGRLSARRSAQICGYCHSYVFYNTAWQHTPPGQELAMEVEPPEHWLRDPSPGKTIPDERNSRFWSDGMVRGSGREYSDLIQSPCHQGGLEEDQMGCLTCHVMHQAVDDSRTLDEWATDQLQPGMDGDRGCAQCHELPNLEEHTHHAADSSGSRCYNCHNPYTTYGLLKAIRSHLNTNPSAAVSAATGRPNACNLCHLDRSLGWTADHLTEWYGEERATLTPEQEVVASSVLQLLRGDARQRVLIAWNMGWEEARRTSGTEWMAPYLGELLQDPYAVVRYVAHDSLRELPGFADFEYDFIGPPAERSAARLRALEVWKRRPAAAAGRHSAVLLDSAGNLRVDLFDRLLRQRDDSAVKVIE